MEHTEAILDVSVCIPMTKAERDRLDEVCGPGQPVKRGAWVREAILRALDREEAKEETA